MEVLLQSVTYLHVVPVLVGSLEVVVVDAAAAAAAAAAYILVHYERLKAYMSILKVYVSILMFVEYLAKESKAKKI